MRRLLALAPLLLAACGHTFVPPGASRTAAATRAAPLGPGYVLLPLASDDESLLGCVLPSEPRPGHALDETAATNPCADQLRPATTLGMRSELEDAEELSATADARAALGVFGFSGQVRRATHLVYKLRTEKRASQELSPEYLACCREKKCGYGVITEIVYGDGEYSAAEETSGGASGDILSIGSARGTATLKVLHKRHVHGWVAAKVVLHPAKAATSPAPEAAPRLSPVGAGATLAYAEESASAQVRELYARESIRICAVNRDEWSFCDGKNNLTENVFARAYGNRMSTKELAPADHWRRPGWFLAHVAIEAASAGLLVYSFSNAGTNSAGGIEPAGGLPLALSALFVAGLNVIPLTLSILSQDGSDTDHDLRREDAQRYVDRYNRALLRDVTSDVARSRFDAASASPPPPRTTLRLIPFGLAGTF